MCHVIFMLWSNIHEHSQECARMEIHTHIWVHTLCVTHNPINKHTYTHAYIYIWDLATLPWLSISLSALFYDTFAVKYKMPNQKKKKRHRKED